MSSQNHISIFDTTLRDGAQSEGISFSLKEQLHITSLLDEFKIDYIEGGWPYSNKKANDYFTAVKNLPLKHAKIVAFGSTRRAKYAAEDDPNLQSIIAAQPDAACIFGKTWDFHVTTALEISLEENLILIEDSIRSLKEHIPEVFFDAEHFFDGYKANSDFALQCLEAAVRGGADVLVLCDTNGGSLPTHITTSIEEVKKVISVPLGIHAHNDAELAVANSIAAIEAGCIQVQGTINGYGERCGNANLSSIIPTINLKMERETSQKDNLSTLTQLSRQISEIANMHPNVHQPYVGASAFSHKGGIHVSAVMKNPETYEHIAPKTVGNIQRVTISEQSGMSNIAYKIDQYEIDTDTHSIDKKDVLQKIKMMETFGYQYEGAEASFELLLKQFEHNYTAPFTLIGFSVLNHNTASEQSLIEATVKLQIGSTVVHTAGTGNGPVSALDEAVRKALMPSYPQIANMRLTDYKVRVLNSTDGTSSKVRVIIEHTHQGKTWYTVGVSANIIEASWVALADSIQYFLLS